jgi:uncharacterized membrane protein
MDSWPIVSIGIVAVIVLLGVLLGWKIVKDRRSGFPSQDERTQRISGRAATYSLFIGLYFILALLFALIAGRELLGYYLFDTGYALIAVLLVQSITWGALRWYFERKGG